MSPRPMDGRNPNPPPLRKTRFKTTRKIHRTEEKTNWRIRAGPVEVGRERTKADEIHREPIRVAWPPRPRIRRPSVRRSVRAR
jgi:hypothetical protein